VTSASSELPSWDFITLRGKEVPVEVLKVPHTTLRFYPENPRIYSHLWNDDGDEPTQDELFSTLAKTDNVRENLVPSIRSNGGLIEPLLVKGTTVLEGNSRLAAYRLLAEADKETWKLVRIRRLPSDISEDDIFSLLGEFHIVGKKDWAPFEQAGYLYRRHINHGVPMADLKQQIGLPIRKIRHLVKVYQFMIDIDDRNSTKWSYYDELLKGRKFEKAESDHPSFRDVAVDKIKSGEIERAVDVRDRLPLIARAGGNTLKRFVSGALSFDEAVSDALLRGAGDYNYKKLNDFRRWLAEGALDEEFRSARTEEKKLLLYELKQLERRIKGLKTHIE
jgi:hypothetical protein